MSGERVYRGAVRALSIGFIVLGFAVLIRTLAAGGGPISLGFLMGLAFIGIGIGRLWAGARMGR